MDRIDRSDIASESERVLLFPEACDCCPSALLIFPESVPPIFKNEVICELTFVFKVYRSNSIR